MCTFDVCATVCVCVFVFVCGVATADLVTSALASAGALDHKDSLLKGYVHLRPSAQKISTVAWRL